MRKWIFNFITDVRETRKMGWVYDRYVGPTCQEEEDHPSSWMILADRRGYVREEMQGVADFLYFSQILWNELRCAVAGHALVDGGLDGPDSGCVSIYCTRCGKDYGTQWLY
jgi:hypothetical protein